MFVNLIKQIIANYKKYFDLSKKKLDKVLVSY